MPLGAVGWGVVAAGALTAGAGYLGAKEQAGAQRDAAGTQMAMFDTLNQQQQPYIQAGYGATQQLSDLLGLQNNYAGGNAAYGGTDATYPTGMVAGTNLPAGYLSQTFDPATFLNSPQYQFQQQQGQQALSSAATPGAGALSGSTLKGLLGFNQGLASTYYQDYANQFQQQQNNIFNRLSGVAGLGQNAAANVGNAGTQLGTGIAQAQAGAGASMGAGIAGVGSSLGQGISLASMFGGSGGSPSGGFTPNPAVTNWQAPTSFFAGA